jgi:hypothetical protein
MGHPAEDDVAEREVAGPDHEDDVTVHGGSTSRLEIDDPRADHDRWEVRGRDRAEGIGEPRVLRALLRDMKISVSRGGRRCRRRRYRWGEGETCKGKDRGRTHAQTPPCEALHPPTSSARSRGDVLLTSGPTSTGLVPHEGNDGVLTRAECHKFTPNPKATGGDAEYPSEGENLSGDPYLDNLVNR